MIDVYVFSAHQQLIEKNKCDEYCFFADESQQPAVLPFLCLWTHGPFYAECIEKNVSEFVLLFVSAKSIP